MNNQKHRVPNTSIGISSLLVLFIIICLVVFAVLTYSTAQRNYDFSKMAADHKTEYYAASNKAEDMLAKECRAATSKDFASWQIKMNDRQVLKVKVKLYPGHLSNQPAYKIETWQVINTVSGDYDKNLDLIK